MPGLIAKLFSGGAKDLVSGVGTVLDNLITNKEELAAAKLAVEQEANRHAEAISNQADELEKAYLADVQGAREREVNLAKATGRMDYMHAAIGTVIMLTFVAVTIFLLNRELPKGNEHTIINLVGMLEGAVIAVVGYYFGSSAGSRIKDMKGK